MNSSKPPIVDRASCVSCVNCLDIDGELHCNLDGAFLPTPHISVCGEFGGGRLLKLSDEWRKAAPLIAAGAAWWSALLIVMWLGGAL